jgi:hypothetical protein
MGPPGPPNQIRIKIMNDVQAALKVTRTIREAIEAARFTRHEAEVIQADDVVMLLVTGIDDDTATRGVTVDELYRLCNVCMLDFDDGVRRSAMEHSGTSASIRIKGVTLVQIAERIESAER